MATKRGTAQPQKRTQTTQPAPEPATQERRASGAYGIGFRGWNGRDKPSDGPTKSAQIIADREAARVAKKKA